jgi:hypothetical protein
METSNIRHECFLFANKMMELSDKKLMISFEIFDPQQHYKDTKKENKNE